jgi:hypothetical protein
MNLATLRVDGSDDAIARLRSSLSIPPDQSWQQGDPRRRGGRFATSGFSVLIADEDTPGAMIARVRQFLADSRTYRQLFTDASVSAELAVGVTAGDSEQYVPFVELGAADLQALADLGISLSVAAYPTSDEANAEAG